MPKETLTPHQSAQTIGRMLELISPQDTLQGNLARELADKNSTLYWNHTNPYSTSKWSLTKKTAWAKFDIFAITNGINIRRVDQQPEHTKPEDLVYFLTNINNTDDTPSAHAYDYPFDQPSKPKKKRIPTDSELSQLNRLLAPLADILVAALFPEKTDQNLG